MKTTWSQSRLATGAALAVWAGCFWFVIFSGRTSFYLASRTTWLAPLGAITLTLAMVGRLLTAKSPHPERLSRPQMRSLALLVAPAIAIAAFPPTTLGSFAVSRRSASVKGAYVSVTGRDLSKGDLSFLDIFGLAYNGELDQLAARAGSISSFTGFITRNRSKGADQFELNRFMITCCPGDAVNIQLRIFGAPPGQFEADDWVRVTGKIYPVGQEVIIDATDVEKVPRPKHPYLNPN